MKILRHVPPELKKTEFKVDNKLSKHLDDDPLLKHMNKSFVCGLVGKGGAGKTTLMTSLLQTKHKFKKVFHKIYVFMPSSSRSSMKNDIFGQLPDDQLFEGVSFDNLSEVYERLLESSEDGKLSLLVFDDVQSYLKKKEVETNLLHIISIRRHLRCSLFILAQNYIKIPKQIRQVFTDTFLFNISKNEYKAIFEEIINISKNEFQDVIKAYREEKQNDSHSFIYIHDYDTVFINWNEVVFDDDLVL
jgi:ABC-type dipeptide/oligopeptide/nickel transport system ATPase component